MLRVFSAFFVTIATAVLVISCGQATAVSDTDRGEALLTIGKPQVQSSAAWVSGTIPLVIANSGASTVTFSMCGTTLERSVAGDWQAVYGIVCALGSPTDELEIPPKSQQTVQFPVAATLGYGIADQWKPPVAGAYRLKATLRANNEILVRVTEAFQLGT